MIEADYIIVGAGTAGCVLADRLSEAGHQVLLLEAGPRLTSPWSKIPVGWTKLLAGSHHNWRFTTNPEPMTMDRSIVVPRGRGLGGSSLINGMIWVRGQREDYDGWTQSGCPGWSFDEVLPYFRRSERWRGTPNALRGMGGRVPVETVDYRSAVAETFLHAAQACGLPLIDDYNASPIEGAFRYQVNQRRGRRVSAADGYLNHARGRPNLRVLTGVHVNEINHQDRLVSGVTYVQGNTSRTARARAELILCAGAVGSPHLLELSGIGDPEILTNAGIACLHPLSPVGRHLADHYCTRMNWRVTQPITLNEATRGWRLAREVLRYAFGLRGALTLGTGLTGAFLCTRDGLATPDIQLFFMHASYANAADRRLDRRPGMTIGVTQLRPQSLGTIHIVSPDPKIQPNIRPAFLKAGSDLDCMVAGMKKARDIMESPVFDGLRATEISPGIECQNDEQWQSFARHNGQSIYHACGTCRMGDGRDTVVDPQLRVHGLTGLRVADASIMPRIVSGNTQAAVYMIAEKASDLILGKAA